MHVLPVACFQLKASKSIQSLIARPLIFSEDPAAGSIPGLQRDSAELAHAGGRRLVAVEVTWQRDMTRKGKRKGAKKRRKGTMFATSNKCIATSNKKLLGAPGLTSSNKDAWRVMCAILCDPSRHKCRSLGRRENLWPRWTWVSKRPVCQMLGCAPVGFWEAIASRLEAIASGLEAIRFL